MPKERKIGLGAFYNLLFNDRNFALAPHHYPIIAALEDDRIQRLLYLAGPGTGKSTLLDIVYACWEIGHDPTMTTLAVSAGEALPQGFMSSVMQIIQHSKVFHELFPDVRPDTDQGWSMQRGLFVTGHPVTDPDANYKAVGVSSKALTGLHAKLQIYDDIHDRENAYTPAARQIVKETYYNTLLGRADPQGCRFVAAGRWWAADDLYQEWINSGKWLVLQLPAERPGSKRLYYDVFVPKDEETGLAIPCVFSETLEPEPDQDPRSYYVRYRAYYSALDKTGRGFYWPASKQKREDYEQVKRRQPRTAAINYNGDMTGGSGAIFEETDFTTYLQPPNLELGLASPYVKAWISGEKGVVEEAWDTALGQPQSSSLTAALTGMFVPCRKWHRGEDENLVGKCDFHYDVYLLDAMIANLRFDELAMALRSRFGKWHPRRVIVEEKQSGVGLLQVFRTTHIPVWGQKVIQGKVERATSAITADSTGLPIPGGAASVQGWVKMGRVYVPGGANWLEEGPDGGDGFLKKVCSFVGGNKASDEFDALVHLVTRAIGLSRQTAYIPGMQSERGSDFDIARPPPGMEDIRQMPMEAFQSIAETAVLGSDGVYNPFDGLCGAPCHHRTIDNNQEWCKIHRRPITALFGCGDWAAQGSVHTDPLEIS